MRGKGVDEGSLSLNWGELMNHKHGFTDRAHVDVAGTSYGASRVLITTGAAPVLLEFPG